MKFSAKLFILVHFLRLSISQLNSTNYALYTKFLQNNFSSESDFVANTSTSFWNTITTSNLLQLGSANLQQLQYDDQGIIPDRIMIEINRLLLSNMTNARIKYNLKLDELSIGALQQLRRSLPLPANFTANNITFLGRDIMKLGSSFLLQINDSSALQVLYNTVYEDYLGSFDLTMTPWYKTLLNHLAVKMYGPPSNWTRATVQNMDLTLLSMDVAKELTSDVIVFREQDFMEAASSDSNYQLGRIYLQKILMKQDFLNNSNVTQVLNIINNSGYLMNYILPLDVSNQDLFLNSNFSDIIYENIQSFALSGQIDPYTEFLILQSFSQMKTIIPGSQSPMETGLIGLATPQILKTVARNGFISANEINKIADVIQNGPGVGNKLQTLANIIRYGTKNQSILTITPYPNKVLSYLPASTLIKITASDASTILSRSPNVTIADNKIIILLNKIQSGFGSLSLKARSLLPNAKIKAMKPLDLVQIANGLPPFSSVAMAVAEKIFAGKRFIDSAEIERSISFVPFLGAKEATKVNKSDIINVLYLLKDNSLSWPACCVLKNIFYNYSMNEMGSISEQNTIQRFTVGDIENMPVCVLACFGTDLTDYLGVDQKVALLTRMGLMENPSLSLPRSFRMKVVTDGLIAVRNRSGIQLGDLDIIGNAIADIPGEVLTYTVDNAVPDVINKLNELIYRTQMRPCFDYLQRAVIGSMVLFIKGSNTTQWNSVADVACLLNYLPLDNLSSIPAEVMALNTCELGGYITIVNKTQSALCRASIGNEDYILMKTDEIQLRTLQTQAAINGMAMAQNLRYKRQIQLAAANDSAGICSQVQYSGANGFSVAGLRSFSFNTIISCLSDFGAKYMDVNKAQILAGILQAGWPGNFTNLNASTLLDMGYILMGIPVTNLQNLGNFSYGTDFDDVVGFLGSQKLFNIVQVIAWANVVKSKWRSPPDMSVNDLLIVNNLLCGFNATDINLIKIPAFMGAVGTISQLDNCPTDPVIISFANVAKLPNAYGNITNWNKSDVAELGVVIAGLAPENLKKLDPTAMEGLSPSAMEIMSLDSLKVLDAAHFLFINTAAGLSIQPQQQSVLTIDVNNILNTTLRSFIATQITPQPSSTPQGSSRNCGSNCIVSIGSQILATFSCFFSSRRWFY